MRIACPSCTAAYNVDERRVPAAGLNVRCPKCQSTFPVRPPPPPAAEAAPVRLPTPPGRAPEEEALGGSTVSFDSPFLAHPPPLPAGEEGAAGMTVRFEAPLPSPPQIAPRATPAPSPPAEEEMGGRTMRFQAPFGGQEPAAPPSGTVALPQPAGAGPVSPTLGFGEVDLPGPANEAPPFAEEAPFAGSTIAETPFEQEPLPVAPDLPPPADPFASAAAVAGQAEPPEIEPRQAAEIGPGALGKAETEELEALFEDAKPAATPVPRQARSPAGPEWRIRRRSGKIFGPFPEAEVVRMLTRGELLGNEEVSSDAGSSWTAIGEETAFADAIRKLIERPEGFEAPTPGSGPPVLPATERPRGPGLGERVASLGGRAAHALDRLPSWARYTVPVAIAFTLLGAGLGTGLTDYGIFFHRLVRGQVGPGRPGAKLCREARARFAEDGWPGAQAALGLAGRAIALSAVDREAKGVEAQVAFWMARRTGIAPAALERARARVAEIEAKSPRDADTLKAQVSMAVAQGGPQGPGAAAELERWLAREPRDEGALYLLGEWALSKGDAGRAQALFERLEQVRPGARSAHALGLSALGRGDDRAAAARFAEALKRDPRHLSSALELAGLSLRAGDLGAAAPRLEELLSPESRELLGPKERARAHQLRGELLARDLGAEPEQRLAEAERELEAAVKEDGAHVPARLAWARFLLRHNAPDRALAALGTVAAGESPEIADLQARSLAGAGRVLDAVNALDAAVARSGASPRLTFARALVLDAGGKRVEAEKLYAEAAKDPNYWEPHLALGRSRLRAGDAAAAAPEILLAAEKAPGEPDAQAGLGELRLARSDTSGAQEAFGKALALDPSHAASHLGMARVALARGDAAAASSSLERAVRFDPRLGEARLLLGGLRWKGGDLPGAATEFKAAADLDPRNALARTRLGAVELEQGRAEAAYGDLLAASNIEVALAENRFWLGRALLAKGDAAQAVEQLARAVELDRGSAQHHLWLGIALERSSKLGEAGDAYRAALQADPKLVEAAERQGLLQANLSRYGEAATWLEKAIQLAPREQRLRMELADCRMKLDQAPQAIRIYKDALRADPKLVALYYRIARAVHESSGAAEAVPWYEKAAQVDRQNPMPHYYLGFHYKVRGKRARAVEAFRAYLKLKPDADDRKDIEREIEDLGG